MFFVMGFLDGRIFWDPSLPELSGNAGRAAIYDAMNAGLAALHGVDIEKAGLADFGRSGSYFARQFSRWTSQYRASETGTVDAMDRLIAWLEEHLPADDGIVSLVHGDYRLDNMIFAPDRPKILAVLDWELSTLGHPYADLAYQCMQWRLPHTSGFKGLGGIDRAAIGLPSEKEYVERYCERRGIAGVGNWTFYLAFSFFRLAAICQGVYKRALDGNASNPEKARTYGEAVKLLAGLAVEQIDGEG
jgi:aminoglycoside phosphotransferase (APT) family kinase protein